jgi:hypothetical protein
VGVVGEIFPLPDGGVDLMVSEGSAPFRKGDSARIAIQSVGWLESEIQSPSAFAIMRSEDATAPEISVSADSRQFADGDYVSSTPNLAVVFRDESGVDPDSIELSLMKNIIEEIEIPDTELVVSPSEDRAVVVNYTPKLSPATYELIVKGADLNGHVAEERAEFVVSKNPGLSDVMNYPNPFSHRTEITCVSSVQMDEMSFRIYTLSGRLIWEEKLTGAVGFVQVGWDGRDQDDREVANGVYYCKVNARKGDNSFDDIIKIMRLR